MRKWNGCQRKIFKKVWCVEKNEFERERNGKINRDKKKRNKQKNRYKKKGG